MMDDHDGWPRVYNKSPFMSFRSTTISCYLFHSYNGSLLFLAKATTQKNGYGNSCQWRG